MASSLAVAAPRTYVGSTRPRAFHPAVPLGARTSLASRAATRAPGVNRSPRRAAEDPVRLTRRGRLVAFAASVGILATVVVSAGQIADASGSTAATEHVTVVVQSGQTLWGIARAAAPDHDPRLVISQIRELNDLGTGSIIPGQALVVPTVA